VSVAFSRTCEVPGLAVAGYAIGRRHGGAVPRNRLRRRLREAVRRAAPGLESGAYLVRAAPEATALAFEELCQVVATASRSAAERAAARGGALR
jgi:ribonuclease P protein component